MRQDDSNEPSTDAEPTVIIAPADARKPYAAPTFQELSSSETRYLLVGGASDGVLYS